MYDCVFENWSPTIGDPSLLGWVTVLGYGLAALLAIRAGLRCDRRDRGLWVIVGIGLVLLMINKQLDLQSAMTALARCHAQLNGWYEDRRPVQILVILAIMLVTSILFSTYLIVRWEQIRRNLLLFVGLFILITFVLVRAVGFHRVDELIKVSFETLRVNHILELGAIVVIAFAALLKPAFSSRRR